jgi:hypothetical protein
VKQLKNGYYTEDHEEYTESHGVKREVEERSQSRDRRVTEPQLPFPLYMRDNR